MMEHTANKPLAIGNQLFDDGVIARCWRPCAER